MTAFAWSLAAWAALALAMDRHHEAALSRGLPPARGRRLRWLAGGLLLAALAHAVAVQGTAFGPLSWAAGVVTSGLATVLLLTWWPTRLPALAGLAWLVGTLAAFAT